MITVGNTATALLLVMLYLSTIVRGQHQYPDRPALLRRALDTLFTGRNHPPFNGVVLVSKAGKPYYAKAFGFADIERRKLLRLSDEFLIGSVSKQITAVIVLREYEAGRVGLDIPIRRYLPSLTRDWADTVTVRQLLTHTHGIRESALQSPLAFRPGSRFAYSQIGYELLSRIVERSSGKSFQDLSFALFRRCDMRHTFYPIASPRPELTCGYQTTADGAIHRLSPASALAEIPIAAGGFVSNARDLMLWSERLHHGGLLRDSTWHIMNTPQPRAVRTHPVFGATTYGCGITIDTSDGIVQLGQTGLVPGFSTLCFYFPESRISVVVWSNLQRETDNLKTAFYYHTAVLSIVRKTLLNVP